MTQTMTLNDLKSFNLEDLGLSSLSYNELEETDGGWILIAAVIVVFAVGVYCGYTS